MQPVLTNHALNHFILYLKANQPVIKSHSTQNKDVQVKSGASHLVIWVRVRPVAGAIKSEKVLAVFVQIVHFIFILKQTIFYSDVDLYFI